MSLQPGDIVAFRANEFNERSLHGRRATVVSGVYIHSWAFSGYIDKYVVEIDGGDMFFPSRREIWGENLELLVLDTMARIQ